MKGGLWNKIRRVALTDAAVLVNGIDADALEEMDRLLVESDFGSVAFDIVTGLGNRIRAGVLRSEESMRAWLTDEVARLATVSGHTDGLDLGDGKGPGVVLLVGVNGVEKTTQAAKLPKLLLDQGKSGGCGSPRHWGRLHTRGDLMEGLRKMVRVAVRQREGHRMRFCW